LRLCVEGFVLYIVPTQRRGHFATHCLLPLVAFATKSERTLAKVLNLQGKKKRHALCSVNGKESSVHGAGWDEAEDRYGSQGFGVNGWRAGEEGVRRFWLRRQ
jgi:hypothetical protein